MPRAIPSRLSRKTSRGQAIRLKPIRPRLPNQRQTSAPKWASNTSRNLIASAARGLPLVALLMAGCADGRRYDQAICVLIDVSGTYADQRMEVVRTIKREELPNMMPGDTLLVLAKGNRLLRVDPEARSVVAEVELPHPLHFAPVVVGKRVFAVVRRDEGRGKFVDILRAWRTEDFSLLWEYEDGKPFKGAVSTDGRSAYLPDSSGTLLRFR